MFPETIETAQLELQALTTESIRPAELHRYCSSHNPTIDEEFRYLPWTPHRTIRETKEWIEEAENQWKEGERATYLIRAGDGFESPGDVAGITMLDFFWDRLAGEPFIWMRKPYWGEGLLTEVAVAIHTLGLVDMQLELIFTEVIEGNDRAKERYDHLCKQHNGTYEGRIRNKVPMDDEVKDVHRYSIDRETIQELLNPDPIDTAPTRPPTADDSPTAAGPESREKPEEVQ